MPLFKFTGPYPTFYGSGLPTASGSGLVNPGDEIDFPEAPDFNWIPVGPETGQEPVSNPAPPVIPDSPADASAAVSEPSTAIPEPDLFRH